MYKIIEVLTCALSVRGGLVVCSLDFQFRGKGVKESEAKGGADISTHFCLGGELKPQLEN